MRRAGGILLGIILLIILIVLCWYLYRILVPTPTPTPTPDPNPVNQAPIAEDEAIDGVVNGTIERPFLVTDPDSDPITITILIQPQQGTLTEGATLNYTYTPNPDFVGTDTFTYEGCDATLCDPATVTINIFNAPTAVDDSLEGQMNEALNGNVLGNDVPAGELMTEVKQESGEYGIVDIDGGGNIAYQPAQDYVGTFTISYNACLAAASTICDDAVVTVNVIDGVVIPSPNAVADSYDVNTGQTLSGNVLDNDDDPNGLALSVNSTPVLSPTLGSLTLNDDGSFTYEPNADIGADTADQFEYELCNSEGKCSQGTVDIAITFVETPPVTKHEVQEGEWLRQIARCYGASEAEIIEANEIKNPNLIYYPGRVLEIPNAGSVGPIIGPPCIDVYFVQSGDTVYSIAQAFGIREHDLRRINQIRFPHHIYVGQRLVIPKPIPDYMQP